MRQIAPLLLLGSLVGIFSNCQQPIYAANISAAATVPSNGAKIEAFVPTGWQIEDKKTGDLNKDGSPDVALQLVKKAPHKAHANADDVEPDLPRMLVILFRQKDGSYTRGGISSEALLSTHGAGQKGAPPELRIEKGVLIEEQSGGGFDDWGVVLRFRYDPEVKKMMLIGFDYDETDTTQDNPPGVSASVNLLTHDRIDKKTKNEADVSKKTLKSKLNSMPLEEFTWKWLENAERPGK